MKNIKIEKIVKYHDSCNMYYIDYKLDGKLYREDGPASQVFYDNGQIYSETYIKDGKMHREDGPSSQYWYNDGTKEKEYYYLNDIGYDKKEWIEELKRMNSQHYKEQKDLYDMEQNMEKYNL